MATEANTFGSGPVNMHEAKSRLSQLVAAVESGREAEVVIARNGKPAARLVPILAPEPKPMRQLGLAAGRFNFNAELSDSMDEEITRMFEEGADPYGEKLPR